MSLSPSPPLLLFHRVGDDDHVAAWAGWWILFPALFGILFYVTLVTALWPLGRVYFPVWLLLLAIFFPFLFPFLLFYVLFFVVVVPHEERGAPAVRPHERGHRVAARV